MFCMNNGYLSLWSEQWTPQSCVRTIGIVIYIRTMGLTFLTEQWSHQCLAIMSCRIMGQSMSQQNNWPCNCCQNNWPYLNNGHTVFLHPAVTLLTAVMVENRRDFMGQFVVAFSICALKVMLMLKTRKHTI